MTYYEIKLTCGDKTLILSPTSYAHLVEGGLNGISSTGFDVAVKSYASTAGGYAERRRFAEREISLTFEVERDATDEIRRMLLSMLNPQKDCELTVRLDSVVRKITVIPSEEPRFTRPSFADVLEVTLNFIAPSVFFRAEHDTTIAFRELVPIFTFPLNFMSEAGTVSGLYRAFDSSEVLNEGDGECGIVARITANGGTVVNPGIQCGELFVKCPLTLAEGDELIIDTRIGQKNILLNGERCFLFDKRSTFFSLPVGASVLSLTADSGGEFLDGSVSFSPIYYGVS